MNNVNKLKIAVLSVAMFGMMSGVANAATQKGNSSVEIVKGLSISPIEEVIKGVPGSGHSDLYFGKVLSPTLGKATLVVSPNGIYTSTGTIALTKGHPATFAVNGAAGKKLTIKVDKSTIMTFGKSKLVASLKVSKNSVTVDKKGVAYFTVGGSLPIAKNQKVGVYKGTFNVTANY